MRSPQMSRQLTPTHLPPLDSGLDNPLSVIHLASALTVGWVLVGYQIAEEAG
jgi:hypothetical protein